MALLTSPAAFLPASFGIITVSDTRTLDDDRSGALIEERLRAAGHRIGGRWIVKDERMRIRNMVLEHTASATLDALIVTGGTGFSPRDVTPEAIEPLFDKPLPGFGELFRMLSFREIGCSTIQSRTCAGLCGVTVVFCLPGSPGACRLAMDEIILPQMDHRHRPCNFRDIVPGPNSPIHEGKKPHQP